MQAVAAARTPDAIEYAGEELAAAQAALTAYDDAVVTRDYRQALSRALDAREKAAAIPKLAAERKAQTRVQAESLIAECNAVLSVLRTRMTAPGAPRPTQAQMARLRQTVRTAPTQIRTAEELVKQESYKRAIAALTPILQSLRQDDTATASRSGR